MVSVEVVGIGDGGLMVAGFWWGADCERLIVEMMVVMVVLGSGW